MNKRFSVRAGLHAFVQQDDCAQTTRKRIWHVFDKHYIRGPGQKKEYNLVEECLSYFGLDYQMTYSPFDHPANIEELRKYITQKASWYHVYDFIEYYIAHCASCYALVVPLINEILEDEQTGYHVVQGLVVNITNPQEIETIENAINDCPEHVAKSMIQALKLYSMRPVPDYNNAIKESITAVESLCCTIVAQNGITDVNTLGNAVNHLSQCGIVLHESLKDAIKSLYKYTCNEDGKRHGGTTFVNSPVEDARFMIITCSAILNFLIVKWNNAQMSFTTT